MELYKMNRSSTSEEKNMYNYHNYNSDSSCFGRVFLMAKTIFPEYWGKQNRQRRIFGRGGKENV